MDSGAEEWARLSPEERERRVIQGTYAVLRSILGQPDATVTFADELTPSLLEEDTERHCTYHGDLLDVGEDETGPWALVRITKHQLQVKSEEHFIPGWEALFNALYSDPESASEGLRQVFQVRNLYPETGEYIDLPCPDEPMKFYVSEMPGCIGSLKTSEE